MSKIAIVLCAASFFASAVASTIPQKLDGKELNLRIAEALMIIDTRINEANTRVHAFGVQPSQKNIDIIAGYIRNVTDHMDGIRKLMNITMRSKTSVFNETECRRYFVRYENLAQDVLEDLNNLSENTVIAAFDSFGDAIEIAVQTLRAITRFRVTATHCGKNCEAIDDTIKSAVNYAVQNIDAALEDYAKLANGSAVEEAVHTETKYDFLFTSEDELWNETLNCVTRSASTAHRN